MGDFRKLIVWQRAKNLVIEVYQLNKDQHYSRDFSFKDQIQRAAVSIPANIAEGDELGTDKQSIRHFYIAKGSCAELQTLLIIGSDIGYIDGGRSEEMIDECRVISIMLARIIKARS